MATPEMRKKTVGHVSFDNTPRETRKSVLPIRSYSWELPPAVDVWTNDEELLPTTIWPQEFLCPISGHPMETPVVLEQNSLRFDLTSFIDWLGQGSTTCPVTGQPLKSPIRLPLDMQLQAEIRAFAAVHDLPLQLETTKVQQRCVAKAYEHRSLLDVEQLLLGLFCLLSK